MTPGSLFCSVSSPAMNQISPSGFHVADPPPGLPESPLPPQAHERGFRWG